MEKERLEISRQQKELDRTRDELYVIDRRVRNSLNASGPPVLRADLPQIGSPPAATPALPPVVTRSSSSNSSPLSSARGSSKTKVPKKQSSTLARANSANSREASPLKTERRASPREASPLKPERRASFCGA